MLTNIKLIPTAFYPINISYTPQFFTTDSPFHKINNNHSSSTFVDKNSNPKFYFRDNGILNLFLNDKRSSLLENVVAISLYRYDKDNLYYLKGKNVDIDFYLSDLNYAIQMGQDVRLLKICNFCNKAFIAKNPKAEYGTYNCKNKANVYKSREKKQKIDY